MPKEEDNLDDLDDSELDELGNDDDLKDGMNDDDSSLWNDDMGFGNNDNSPLKKHGDLLKDLTNFSPYLRKVFNNWLGIKWDEQTEKFVRDETIKPVMSVQGAAWCINFLDTYARGNNIITDIKQEDYNYIVADMIDTIYLNIGTRDEFEIKNDGDIIMVGSQLLHSAQLILMGAGDGKYNKFLGTTYSSHANISPQQNPMMQYGQMPQIQSKKEGMINKIKSGLMGKAF